MNKPGEDDLLALEQQGLLDKKAQEPLKALDPKGGEITISQDLEGVFQHVIMNSLWEYYSDKQAAGWLQVAGKLLATEGRVVVSLMRNTYQDSSGQDQLIPIFRKSNRLGLDPERMHYRTIVALEKNGLAEKAGFVIKDRADGTIFPVVLLGRL